MYKPSLVNLVIQARDKYPSIDAYTSFIQRYCLHGLLFWIDNRLFHSNELISLSINEVVISEKEKHIIHKKVLSDIKNMEQQCIDYQLEETLKSILITDSFRKDVLIHQLELLVNEFTGTNIDFQDYRPQDNESILELMSKLVTLENQFAFDVEDCKGKDRIRESDIIGEFSYNPSTGNKSVNIDAVIASARRRSSGISEYVEKIRLEMS